jgi:hypothetical protein
MIVTVPILPQLGLGLDNAVVEAADSRIRIPNTFFAMFEPSLPLGVASVSNVTMETSFFMNSILARVNQIQGSQVMATLGRGLWDIDFNVAIRFNYTAVGIATSPDVSILFSNTLYTTVLYGRFASIGSFSDNYKFRLFNQEPLSTIIHFVGATGVGQNLDSQISVVARKVL